MNRSTYSRRQFVRLFGRCAGCFVATASLTPLSGCSKPQTGRVTDTNYSFPQGIASADPQPDAIMLWTRIEADIPSVDCIDLKVQLAKDPGFNDLLLEKGIQASNNFDFTVRVFVEGLTPATPYFYRFVAPSGTVSRTGRTRTAPAPDSNETLTVAVMSCQNYFQGFFGAYRHMINDDLAAVENRKIDVVIHVGDYIYEDAPQNPDVELLYSDGRLRGGANFPSGGRETRRSVSADTIDDYRYLYRLYLSDPDLQEARALYPFVHTWDDHEMVNDYWQSFHPSGPMQRTKININQAWFEYMPAALSAAPSGPAGFNPAHDFEHPGPVDNLAASDLDDSYLSHEPNNLKAIGSLSIYRSLPWGNVADLIVIDGRSYRGERGLDASLLGTERIAYPATPVPTQAIEILNAGRTANDSNPHATLMFDGREIENPRSDAPIGSMLGAEQKSWFKSSLTNSTARWKLICNNTPMLRFGFDMTFRENGGINDIWWSDSWDGYPVERRELTQFIRENEIPNVVSLTGDRHGQYAGYVADDYDATVRANVIPEFASAGVSARSRLELQYGMTRRDAAELLPRVGFRPANSETDFDLEPSLNAWLLYGNRSAKILAESGDEEVAMAAADERVNPHLLYADNHAFGYFTAHISNEAMQIEFVTIDKPVVDYGEDGPPAIRRIRYSLAAWDAGGVPEISSPEIIGAAPRMGIRDG